jgi:PAS domain S-box-containing protein
MTLTIQQFYRIAVQQLPELETKPLIQHVVRLYAEVLNPRYAFVFNMQGDELIFAANKPHDALVSEIKRNFKTSDGASSIQIETIQLESNYFTVFQLDETFVFALGFNEPVLDEELVMLQEVSSALAVRMKLLAAQTRNSLFQQLIDNSSDAIQIAQSNGQLYYINDVASKRLGIDQADAHKFSVLDFQRFFKSQAEWDEHIKDYKINPVKRFENFHDNVQTGKRTPVETSIRYIEIGNQGYLLTIARDITQRVESQNKLIEREAHLKAVLDSSPESIWSVNENYELLFANRVLTDGFEAVFNIKLDIGTRMIDVVPPEMGNMYKERYDHVLKNNMLEFTESIPSPHGTRRTNVSMIPVVMNDKVIAVSVFGVDITEQEHNRMVLRESENRFYKMFSDNTAAMYLIDPETHAFIDVNPACEKLYGWSRAEFLDKKISNVNVSAENVNWQIEKLQVERSGFFVCKHSKKDGTVMDLEISSCMIIVDNQEIVYEIVHDITERNQFYAVVSDQNKLLKDIAWVQSHVVRAPLARILGLIDLLEDEDFKELSQTEIVALISESAHELDGIIRTITNQSHELSKKGIRINPE